MGVQRLVPSFQVRLYRAAVSALPEEFRRRYGQEMAEVFEARIAEARATGDNGTRTTLVEILNLLTTGLRLRLAAGYRRIGAPRYRAAEPVRLRGRGWGRAALAAVLVTLLSLLALDLEVGGRGGSARHPAPPSARSSAELDFHAHDPAGEFTLSIRQGRVVAATVDGARVPRDQLLVREDSIHFVRPDGAPSFSVHFDRERGRISWEAREPTWSPAQEVERPSVQELARILDVMERLRALGTELGPDIFPGFRPDTIPVRIVLPDRGSLLVNWAGPLPDGYEPVGPSAAWQPVAEQSAASTGTELGGRPVAQVVLRPPLDPDQLLGLAAHEAFHVFQTSRHRPGGRFGTGENSFLVSRYPVFDVANERDLALEGRLLAAAVRARSREGTEEAAEGFLAVREARQRRLGFELAEFETAAELNEGLAEYALVRVLAAADDGERGERPYVGFRSIERLDDLTGDPTRSIRLRFYSTGAALALVLDRLAGSEWKRRLLEDNLTLQDALARAIGYRERETRLRDRAADRHGRGLETLARNAVESLRRHRTAQADSILAAPGIRVIVSMDRAGTGIGLCGIDPQNLLQGPDRILLHTRWLRPCSGDALQGEFNTGVVHDRDSQTLAAVAGADVCITVGGVEVRLEPGESLEGVTDVVIASDRLNLTSAYADVRREGRTIRLTPLPR